MKRTQLKRTPWKRKQSKRTRHQLSESKTNGTFQDFTDWRATQTNCYFCGWKLGTRWPHSGWLPRLEANHCYGHALRGATRYAIFSIIMLCQFCHQEVWPYFRGRQRVLFGAAMKLESDSKRFDLAAMNAMRPSEPITLTELREFLDTDLPAIRRKYLNPSPLAAEKK